MNTWVRAQWVAVIAVVNSSALTAYGRAQVPVHDSAGKYPATGLEGNAGAA
jgi:hypothetical protein